MASSGIGGGNKYLQDLLSLNVKPERVGYLRKKAAKGQLKARPDDVVKSALELLNTTFETIKAKNELADNDNQLSVAEREEKRAKVHLLEESQSKLTAQLSGNFEQYNQDYFAIKPNKTREMIANAPYLVQTVQEPGGLSKKEVDILFNITGRVLSVRESFEFMAFIAEKGHVLSEEIIPELEGLYKQFSSRGDQQIADQNAAALFQDLELEARETRHIDAKKAKKKRQKERARQRAEEGKIPEEQPSVAPSKVRNQERAENALFRRKFARYEAVLKGDGGANPHPVHPRLYRFETATYEKRAELVDKGQTPYANLTYLEFESAVIDHIAARLMVDIQSDAEMSRVYSLTVLREIEGKGKILNRISHIEINFRDQQEEKVFALAQKAPPTQAGRRRALKNSQGFSKNEYYHGCAESDFSLMKLLQGEVPLPPVPADPAIAAEPAASLPYKAKVLPDGIIEAEIHMLNLRGQPIVTVKVFPIRLPFE